MNKLLSRSVAAGVLSMGLVLCLTPRAARADAKDDVQSALQKLNDAKSYSWESKVEGTGPGTGSGKTEKDGYTTLTMTLRDNTMDAVIKGDKSVLKTDDGWKTPEDLADAQGPQRMMGGYVRNYKVPGLMVQDLVEQVKTFTKGDDGAYTADLDEPVVKKLMAMNRRRRNPNGDANAAPQISNAKGTAKLTLADGVLSKVEVHVSGTMSINGNDRDIDRTTSTEIKDVDKTTVDVPAEAKAKLEGAAAPAAANPEKPAM